MIGTTLAHYRITAEIDEGGTGEVWPTLVVFEGLP